MILGTDILDSHYKIPQNLHSNIVEEPIFYFEQQDKTKIIRPGEDIKLEGRSVSLISMTFSHSI